jgi:hypothetical protein
MATEYAARSNLEMLTTRERLGLDSTKAAFLEWLNMEERERQEKYESFREYYDGKHAVMLTDRQKKFLELETHQNFQANLCPMVVDELERRMIVRTFDADGNRKLGGHKGMLWKWWRRDGMDADQSDTHLSAIRDGDSYVIVTWNHDENRPEFHHNLAYDGDEGVKCHYSDETGKVAYATKRWLVTDPLDPAAGTVKRMNIYWPDRVERYIADGTHNGFWYGYTRDGEDAVLPWVDALGKPLGVPVFHLKHKPAGYRWGKSILEDVIPLQNGLNKSIVDVIAAADTTGFRMYWATGTDMTDENDDPIMIHPGTFLTSSAPEASFGWFPGEDMRPLIEVVDMFKVTIAQVSETPIHLFQVSGQNASEGAQKQQEVAMINKAEKWGRAVGNFWENCMQMAIKLSNVNDGTSYPTDLILQTVWEDAEVRDKTQRRKEQAETAKIWTDAGASIEEAAKAAGMTEEEAKDLAKMALPKLMGLVPGTGLPGAAPAAPKPKEPNASKE